MRIIDITTNEIKIDKLQNIIMRRSIFPIVVQTFIEPGVRVIILESEQNEILGWMLMRNISNQTVSLEMLEVFKKRKGYGSLLIEYLKDNYEKIELESLRRSTKFYLKNGFKVNDKGMNRIYMCWER